MRLLRRPMAEDDFWDLIEVMGGSCDEDAVARLNTALEVRGGKAAMAFQECLARLLYELDRERLAEQPVRFGDDIDTKVSYETGSNHKHWAPQPKPEREPWYQGLRPVTVDCRDLSDTDEVERLFADGHTEPSLVYPYPRYVSDVLADELVMTFSRLVALNGGLPPGVDARQVQVLIDFGDAWQIHPEVGEPAEDPDLGIGRVRSVRVGACAEDVRRWSPATRREALLALTASCLLAVLPGDHAARPEIEAIRDAGARHLPG